MNDHSQETIPEMIARLCEELKAREPVNSIEQYLKGQMDRYEQMKDVAGIHELSGPTPLVYNLRPIAKKLKAQFKWIEGGATLEGDWMHVHPLWTTTLQR